MFYNPLVLTLCCFNTPCQYTPLLNLFLTIFSLTPLAGCAVLCKFSPTSLVLMRVYFYMYICLFDRFLLFQVHSEGIKQGHGVLKNWKENRMSVLVRCGRLYNHLFMLRVCLQAVITLLLFGRFPTTLCKFDWASHYVIACCAVGHHTHVWGPLTSSTVSTITCYFSHTHAFC